MKQFQGDRIACPVCGGDLEVMPVPKGDEIWQVCPDCSESSYQAPGTPCVLCGGEMLDKGDMIDGDDYLDDLPF